jgi:lysophospholipase L1-like esterase
MKSNTQFRGQIQPGYRWLSLATLVATMVLIALAVAPLASRADGQNDRAGGRHWVATWATAPGNFFFYTAPVSPSPGPPPVAHLASANIQPDLAFPFPTSTTGPTADMTTPIAVNPTFRSIVKPDLWGDTMRFRFSNFFGTQAVTFSSVTVGLQEYSANIVSGTLMRVTFGGGRSVTIQPGQEIFSDAVRLRWVRSADDPDLQGRNLAVSYSVQGNSGPMTFHGGANQTSFITPAGSGDHTADRDAFAFEFTTASWFFIDAVDVMASSDTVVVCAFGDSITDGTHTTLNTNDRWSNALSRRLHNAYGTKVSVVNEAIGGNKVVNPLTGPGGTLGTAASGPAAVDRLDRDVLGLSGLTDVIWLEGINDLGGNHSVADIEGGYQNIVGRLHAKGIKVYGATMTSALGVSGGGQG